MKTRYYLDSVEINEPNNYPELEIEINYDKDGNKESASINNWVFGVNDRRNSNDSVGLIENQIAGGLTGGVGVLEGKPFKVVIDNQRGTSYTLFDGYINISKGKILCNEITCPAVEQGKVDWLNDVADSVSYEYLFNIGFFDSSSFVPVPYCISKKQNATEIIVTIVSIFVMAQALQQQIVAIAQKAAEAGNPFQSVTAIAGLILQIVYIATLLFAIVKLLLDLYNMVIQPVKYHNGMYVKDLIEIGLRHFGLTFSSSILQQHPYDKLLIIPEKYNVKESNTGLFKNIVGQLTPDVNERNGFYKGTFGELLRSIKEMFHAKIIIDNGVLYFEKQDYNITAPLYTFPELVNTGYQFNEEELKSNFIFSFSVDFEDRNTISEYTGTAYQVIHSAISVTNPKMNLIKGVERVTLPFALGKRKTELTNIEEVLDIFFQIIGTILDAMIFVVNLIIQAINVIIRALNRLLRALRTIGINLGNGIGTIPTINSPNLQNLIGDRINMLKMEGDYVNIPKMILVENNANKRNNKLITDNETFLSAKYIYNNYHYFRNFVTTNGWNNQALKRNFDTIPFIFTDYEKLRINNRALTYSGIEASLRTLKFNCNEQTAKGSYNERQTWTNNLKLTYIEPTE